MLSQLLYNGWFQKVIATIINQSQPNCLLINCYCHALNLAVGDAIKNVPVLKECLEGAYKLAKLINIHPNVKRLCRESKKNSKLTISI